MVSHQCLLCLVKLRHFIFQVLVFYLRGQRFKNVVDDVLKTWGGSLWTTSFCLVVDSSHQSMFGVGGWILNQCQWGGVANRQIHNNIHCSPGNLPSTANLIHLNQLIWISWCFSYSCCIDFFHSGSWSSPLLQVKLCCHTQTYWLKGGRVNKWAEGRQALKYLWKDNIYPATFFHSICNLLPHLDLHLGIDISVQWTYHMWHICPADS